MLQTIDHQLKGAKQRVKLQDSEASKKGSFTFPVAEWDDKRKKKLSEKQEEEASYWLFFNLQHLVAQHKDTHRGTHRLYLPLGKVVISRRDFLTPLVLADR